MKHSVPVKTFQDVTTWRYRIVATYVIYNVIYNVIYLKGVWTSATLRRIYQIQFSTRSNGEEVTSTQASAQAL